MPLPFFFHCLPLSSFLYHSELPQSLSSLMIVMSTVNKDKIIPFITQVIIWIFLLIFQECCGYCCCKSEKNGRYTAYPEVFLHRATQKKKSLWNSFHKLQAQDTFPLPLSGGLYLSSKLQVSSLLQGTGYNMDNLEHLKFCQQPIEDLILFSKLATKNLTCNFLLESETTYEKPSVTIHVDIGLISLQFM